MNFRVGTVEDLELMETLSINQKHDRKFEAEVDHFYTLEHDGEILGVGGFRVIVPATAWCWVDFSEYGVHHIRETYRVTRDWIDQWAKKMNIKRLQAFVKDQPNEKRLVKHLGFEQESVMKNFYGDNDALMFVRIF
jgi:N-acetylglutamate synthase-like GNAT family acetyltransferase